ncbi:MAG: hypothetical protein JSV33_04175 [bacterium]|nr:MAG: hypothetical protein JSV33_04175 [bacterium]
MIKYPHIPAAVLFFFLIPLRFAGADIAPDPMTGGYALRRYDEEMTDVRMVAEDVVVRVFENKIVTTADFSMHNEGETVRMDVGFPYSYPGEFIEFRAYVNGRRVNVKDGKKKNVGRKKVTVFWKLWNMTFRKGRSYDIRVEYKTKPFEPHIFTGENRYSSLPEDTYKEMQTLTRSGSVFYWLGTGKHWKGKLDRCRIAFELVGKSSDNIRSYGPDDGIFTGTGVVWEYNEYEPRSFMHMRYYPNMVVKDIPSYLCGIIEQYPDDPKLASDIGRSIQSRFGDEELKHKIYHSFLARWDEPIPQLMEYASGRRCRFDFKSNGRFYTTWRMARILFKEYERQGNLEKVIDIAPIVSRISGAIVDSLDTCGNLPKTNANLLKNAKELLDISNSLIDKEN